MQVPLTVRRLAVRRLVAGHPLPCAAAEHGLPVGGREFAVCAPAVAEDIAVAGRGAGRRAQRLLEPHVPPGGVVGDDVHHDLEGEAVCLGDHGVEVVEGAQAGVDVTVVGDVVAAVGEFGGVERAEPEGVHAQCAQMRQTPGDALQVTQSVAVGVGEAARVHLVEDRLAPPVGVPGGKVQSRFGHSLSPCCGSSRTQAVHFAGNVNLRAPGTHPSLCGEMVIKREHPLHSTKLTPRSTRFTMCERCGACDQWAGRSFHHTPRYGLAATCCPPAAPGFSHTRRWDPHVHTESCHRAAPPGNGRGHARPLRGLGHGGLGHGHARR